MREQHGSQADILVLGRHTKAVPSSIYVQLEGLPYHSFTAGVVVNAGPHGLVVSLQTMAKQKMHVLAPGRSAAVNRNLGTASPGLRNQANTLIPAIASGSPYDTRRRDR